MSKTIPYRGLILSSKLLLELVKSDKKIKVLQSQLIKKYFQIGINLQQFTMISSLKLNLDLRNTLKIGSSRLLMNIIKKQSGLDQIRKKDNNKQLKNTNQIEKD